MKPTETGKKYDKIAKWWNERHQYSTYGLEIFEKALEYNANIGSSLDVGCGSGGRFIKKLVSLGSEVLGIDVSEEMISLARKNHPDEAFGVQDICTLTLLEKYDVIYAWDSIFHLPLNMHEPVITKLCAALQKGGVIMYTFGNEDGEHVDEWMNDEFYYSSIGIDNNIKLLMNNDMTIMYLELDQYPEKHVTVIARRN